MPEGNGWELLDDDAFKLLAARGDQGNMATNLAQLREFLENMPYPDSLPQIHSIAWIEIPGPDGNMIPVEVVRPNDRVDAPPIMYFHGGGMVMGSAKASHPVAVNLAHYAQATVFNVDYRLAPEHPIPAQAEDCYAATVWVSEHADELHVDASRLVTCGDSAGGTLAAAVPHLTRERGGPSILCQVIFYGGVCLDFGTESMRTFANAPGLTRESAIDLNLLAGAADLMASPAVTPGNVADLTGLPQAIIITAEVDPIRDWSEQYATRLRDQHVQVTLTRYPGMYHGFIVRVDDLKRARLAMAETGALLQAKFANPLAG